MELERVHACSRHWGIGSSGLAAQADPEGRFEESSMRTGIRAGLFAGGGQHAVELVGLGSRLCSRFAPCWRDHLACPGTSVSSLSLLCLQQLFSSHCA